MTQKKPYRLERVQHLMRAEISDIINNELKDPRIGMLSITRVLVSKDLGVAKVYFSTFKEEDAEETLEGLNNAKGYIFRALLKRLSLKQIPELRFFIDTSIKYARYIEDKMKKIVKADNNDKSE